MEYKALVAVYLNLEKTTKRLEKTAIIAEFLKKVAAGDLPMIIQLVEGRVFPENEDQKIGFSSRLILKAIASSSGVDEEKVENVWSKVGDLGTVAEQLLEKRVQMTLLQRKVSVEKVYKNIRNLAELEGAGTVSRKVALVAELLTSSSPIEARFIVRTILETLRIGTAAGIIRDAIASAFEKDVNEVEAAFDVIVDYGEVAQRAKNNKLHTITLNPGKPMKVMLALLVKDVADAFIAVGKPALFEYKLDGFRLQIHKSKEKIMLFTRRMENVTKQFPDVVAVVKKQVKGSSFIIDCEAVGIDMKTGRHLPFQMVSQRIKRKYTIEEMARKFPVELNVFDVMYYNEKSLLHTSQAERRKLLETIVLPQKCKVKVTTKMVTANVKDAETFYKKSLEKGNEGLIGKNLAAVYRPGRYVEGWVKLKPTLEPLDVVIVKAEYGEGKRATWLSSFTIACASNGDLLEIGKVSTGLKEKEDAGVSFKEMTSLLKPLIISKKGKGVEVKPKVVIEVGYEEIQKSPTYTSGYALRFPRVLRLREDKSVKEISNLEMVESIYHSQKGKK